VLADTAIIAIWMTWIQHAQVWHGWWLTFFLKMLLIMLPLTFVAWFQIRNIPRLLRVRLLKKNEIVRFPLEETATVPVKDESVPFGAVPLEATKDDRPDWVCPKCRETNPGNFNECWKCLSMRPEA
jgi:hypothetical protein